ncbi:hypothetical protein Tco_0255737 [Tanacetum coccineum]
MASELSSQQPPKQLTPASNVHFECEDGRIAFNNNIALFESKIPLYHDMLQFLSNSCISTDLTKQPSAYYSKYLREFWYTAKVESAMNTITCTLSNFNKPLSFNLEDFSSINGLNYTKNFTPLPQKEMVRDALETLGLVDENDPKILSFKLVNSSKLRIRYISTTWKGLDIDIAGEAYINENLKTMKSHHITASTFKPSTAYEVPLTSYMRKVAKLSEQLEKPLILPSEEVNTDTIADKSLSGTSVQHGAQYKATTNKKHVEEPVTAADATKGLDDFKSAEEQDNQPKTVDAEKVQENIVDKAKHIVKEKEDDDEFIDSKVRSLGNVTFEELYGNVEESPYDTKSEIKVVKRINLQHSDDDDDIKFMGPVYSDIEDDIGAKDDGIEITLNDSSKDEEV